MDGLDDLTPRAGCQILSILTGGGLTPNELLSDAHVLLVLAADERLYLAVARSRGPGKRGSPSRHQARVRVYG